MKKYWGLAAFANRRNLKLFWVICLSGLFQFAFAQTPTGDECINYNTNPQDIAHNKSSRVDAAAFEQLEGKFIRNINFQQLKIFDENNPDENNGLYRTLNKLHITTRTNVVKSQLLFKSGDPVDASLLEETGRILRTRKYFTNAYVLPERVCGDQVDVVVVTQDAWALEPQIAYSHQSASNQTGFTISDGNILGTGNAFAVGYSQSQLRNTVSYDFSNPYFLNRQIALKAEYQETSDGRNVLLDVSHPFYSLDTPWASGGKISDLSLVEAIRSRGKIVNEYRHQTIDNEVYVGDAFDINERFTQRWLAGYTEEQDSFYPTESTLANIPLEDKAHYPWIEYQYLENKFGVFKNLNQIQRPEDVPLGQRLSVRLGFAGTAFGNPDDVLRYKAIYSQVLDIEDKHIFEYNLKVDGRKHFGLTDLDPVLLSSRVAYNYFQDEKNRWYVKLEYALGENLQQYQELTVGDITGLRGYPTDYLRGNKRYAFSLERRYFSDVHIFNLVRMGAVVFFDAGKAWGLSNEPAAPLLSDVGVGLRFCSTKVRIGNVIHVDLAMPTSAKEGISKYQLTIGAEQKF